MFASLRSLWVSPAEVRAETFALGGRHQGMALEGAQIELRAPDLPFRRAILLRAVIRGLA